MFWDRKKKVDPAEEPIVVEAPKPIEPPPQPRVVECWHHWGDAVKRHDRLYEKKCLKCGLVNVYTF